jgi:hypothetical protein
VRSRFCLNYKTGDATHGRIWTYEGLLNERKHRDAKLLQIGNQSDIVPCCCPASLGIGQSLYDRFEELE